MKLGVDVFLDSFEKDFSGQKLGLLTNITGVNKQLNSTIDLMYNSDLLNLHCLFSPEHGIRGNANEGEHLDSTVDEKTGLPVYSLYGEVREPTAEMLDGLDVVIFDLQDIGSRYYTFIYSMANMMKACAKYNVKFVVLDRPNPINGFQVEGNIVEDGFTSFVGLYPIPVRHGMTVGELANYFNEEYSIGCSLDVIQMQDWERKYYYDEMDLCWVAPTPNVTQIDMCVLYPGTCLIEGTNVSEGRGTTKPFEYVGAPFINADELTNAFNNLEIPGVKARPVFFTPHYQKFKGEPCAGVQLHVLDREKFNSFYTGVKLLEIIYNLYPNDIEFIKSLDDSQFYFLDLLAGTDQLRHALLVGKADDWLNETKPELERFIQKRDKYLMY
ncbi:MULTISPECIES: exo-beta-N-acetylmuramidase NamZ domain-containing protein [Allobacillus]|uniref:DUF1343 domain-containing protein n=1 Tax=Allobacillus salarius TaxID=1955272 RepID=A0A556PDV6_9BACI|nr:DUF1343 domain-containing protein [Allobacillus salarius]TSJ62553.1 DUF1343 domain-containing protein [Allobacillus salarius]